MATFGEKRLHLGLERKHSQAAMAVRLNVSQNAYNKREADKGNPKSDNLKKITAFSNKSYE
jgi:transcriptional regulator with XRE-family HTH domain